jgi:DNA repair protein RadC
MWILNELIIHPREVFSTAIEDRANSIIIVHNHPSWTLEPSSEDINMTNRIKQTSDIVWIKLLDHIIISSTWYYSFNKNDLL